MSKRDLSRADERLESFGGPRVKDLEGKDRVADRASNGEGETLVPDGTGGA